MDVAPLLCSRGMTLSWRHLSLNRCLLRRQTCLTRVAAVACALLTLLMQGRGRWLPTQHVCFLDFTMGCAAPAAGVAFWGSEGAAVEVPVPGGGARFLIRLNSLTGQVAQTGTSTFSSSSVFEVWFWIPLFFNPGSTLALACAFCFP